MLYIERRGVHEMEHWARDAQLRNYLFMRGHQKQLCVASPVLHFVDTSAFFHNKLQKMDKVSKKTKPPMNSPRKKKQTNC